MIKRTPHRPYPLFTALKMRISNRLKKEKLHANLPVSVFLSKIAATFNPLLQRKEHIMTYIHSIRSNPLCSPRV